MVEKTNERNFEMLNFEDIEIFIKENLHITDEQTARETAKIMSKQLEVGGHILYGVRYQQQPTIYFYPMLLTDTEFLKIKETFNNVGDLMVFAIHAPYDFVEVKR